MRDEKKLDKSKEKMLVEDEQQAEEFEQTGCEVKRMAPVLRVAKCSKEEQEIMAHILRVFDENDIGYSYDQEHPEHLDLGFSMENKPFRMHVILQNGKVIFRLSFPFRVQCNAIPMMAVFMAGFNADKAFSVMNLDLNDGELTMNYSYLLDDPERFREEEFMTYMMSLIHSALEIYTEVAYLSMGMVAKRNKEFYQTLIRRALETIEEQEGYNDHEISYGVGELNLFRTVKEHL